MPQHIGEKCKKTVCISSILSSKRGITPTTIDRNLRQSNLICSTVNKVICKISAQYVTACRRKVRNTVFFQYSKFQKGHNSYKNWLKLTTLELGVLYPKTTSYGNFQLNMSKHAGEKCGKLWLTDVWKWHSWSCFILYSFVRICDIYPENTCQSIDFRFNIEKTLIVYIPIHIVISFT